MDQQTRRKQSFLLRLPTSLREQAIHIAQTEGTSLNHFISIALAEKVSRMESHEIAEPRRAGPESRMGFSSPMRMAHPAVR